MKLSDFLTEALYGNYEIVEDPNTPQWLVRRNNKIVQQFPYTYGDTVDKLQEKKNAIKWARTQLT